MIYFRETSIINLDMGSVEAVTSNPTIYFKLVTTLNQQINYTGKSLILL